MKFDKDRIKGEIENYSFPEHKAILFWALDICKGSNLSWAQMYKLQWIPIKGNEGKYNSHKRKYIPSDILRKLSKGMPN
jgi:hypothetical protein